MSSRVFNFSPGPAMLPEPVIQQMQTELLDYRGLGMSVMEMSHRGKDFVALTQRCESLLRDILAIPDEYALLYMTGGASGQYAAIPFNLLKGRTSAAYVDTGAWSRKAIAEAERYTEVHIAAKSTAQLPDAYHVRGDEAYLHYVDNETIHGVEYVHPPTETGLPLIADMSSNLLSKPLDVSSFDMFYAGTQKNLGIAGLTLVVIRRDCLGFAHPLTPSIMNYQVMADSHSLYNTAPTFPWYALACSAEWVAREGGLAEMDRRAKWRSAALYRYIDQSDFYRNDVCKAARSRMNVVFTLPDPQLEQIFVAEAAKVGLVNLKGHRSVGGIRASLYNSMPEEAIEALLTFMQAFEDKYQ